VATTEPFPALIELELASFRKDTPILPDSFLGGSTPSLRSLKLWGIPFPALGKLLLSTRELVALSLGYIPNSGYISPEAMAAILSTLTRLQSLHLGFETPQFWTQGPNRRPSAASVLTRVILPALTTFEFAGDSKYLGDIASRIDSPLDYIAVTVISYDQDRREFDFPLLRDFICRTKILKAPHRAEISFSNCYSRISLFQRKEGGDFKVLNLAIPCYTTDSLLVLAQACSSLLVPLPSLEHLSIYRSKYEISPLQWEDEVENSQWMVLLRPFIAVKDLVLEEPVVLSVASALQELVGEQVTEILPSLQNIFLEGFQSSSPVPEGIAKFIAARELCDRPVVVHLQETKQQWH
jgi:hypothetical protein